MTPKTRILLGVTGGIAAYKSPDLVRRLIERGAEVQVVMTAGAQRFVTPMSFQAVSGRPDAHRPVGQRGGSRHGSHRTRPLGAARADRARRAPISSRAWPPAAPMTSSRPCASPPSAPMVLAPAMNRVMWANKATQANVDTLISRGVRILGPGSGRSGVRRSRRGAHVGAGPARRDPARAAGECRPACRSQRADHGRTDARTAGSRCAI